MGLHIRHFGAGQKPANIVHTLKVLPTLLGIEVMPVLLAN
jgi:hypothetical protein